ncbi:hypothetical protein L1887_24832 [Cichorium endivia]|nr:hypothetical protein L1887_24832 [Cichorium endivia]
MEQRQATVVEGGKTDIVGDSERLRTMEAAGGWSSLAKGKIRLIRVYFLVSECAQNRKYSGTPTHHTPAQNLCPVNRLYPIFPSFKSYQ